MLCSKLVLLFLSLSLGTQGYADALEFSRLRYTIPPNWQRKVDTNTMIVSLVAPGSRTSLSFLANEKFEGTTEEWLEENWKEVLKHMTPTKLLPSGQQGPFMTRMGAFSRADGSKSWLGLYVLVKSQRGEGVVYHAADSDSFLENLDTVNAMLQSMRVVDQSAGLQSRTNTSGRIRMPETAGTPAVDKPSY